MSAGAWPKLPVCASALELLLQRLAAGWLVVGGHKLSTIGKTIPLGAIVNARTSSVTSTVSRLLCSSRRDANHRYVRGLSPTAAFKPQTAQTDASGDFGHHAHSCSESRRVRLLVGRIACRVTRDGFRAESAKCTRAGALSRPIRPALGLKPIEGLRGLRAFGPTASLSV